MDLKPYICERCGAPINVAKMKCEYCGTKYHNDALKEICIKAIRPGEHAIFGQVRIPREAFCCSDPEDVRDYSLRKLREQIADGLLGYLKIETCRDYIDNCEIIRGEVRVIDPMFNTY
jgi:hypothetical protein